MKLFFSHNSILRKDDVVAHNNDNNNNNNNNKRFHSKSITETENANNSSASVA